MTETKHKVANGITYEYTLYDKVDPHADILKQKLEPFDFANPPTNPRRLAISLIETMVKYRGVGLSANQVGLPYRVFVMGAEKVGFACFNPEILESYGEETMEEGCISFPGLYLKIKRAASIKVRYTDMNGETKEEVFSGFTARIFQHELDHLNGTVYTSKVSRTVLERAKDKVKTNLKKVTRMQETFKLQQEMKKEPTPAVSTNPETLPNVFTYSAETGGVSY
jgi:peptide deformylase